MKNQQIQPQNVTKPIQLLAAWLVGLIAINGSFLGAANVISSPSWAAGLLVIASVVNVPLFLCLIFFLQTKFRAELQEDSFYSKHLDKVTGTNDSNNASFNAAVKADVKKVQQENSANYESLQNELKSLAASINDITSISVSTDIETHLASAQEKVVELEMNNKKSSSRIAVNSTLKEFHAISRKLFEEGFALTDTFGNDQLEFKTISYINATDKEVLLEVINILKPFGFDRIDYDPEELSYHRSAHIYIGSYIDNYPESRHSMLISSEVIAILEDDKKDLNDLNNFILDSCRN